MHIRHHTGKNPYKLGQCDMAITNQKNITVHLRPHTGENPYQCSQCESDFTCN